MTDKRIGELLNACIGWICEVASNNEDLYSSLHNVIGLSDSEIEEVGIDYLNEYCKVIYLPRTEGVSSSEIRAERRKLIIGTIGDGKICKKFVREMQYVNGVEYRACGDSLDGVDAVYIASHPSKHYADVKRALSAGKHVLCESPIALSVEQYEELNQLAHKHEYSFGRFLPTHLHPYT